MFLFPVCRLSNTPVRFPRHGQPSSLPSRPAISNVGGAKRGILIWLAVYKSTAMWARFTNSTFYFLTLVCHETTNTVLSNLWGISSLGDIYLGSEEHKPM